MAVTTTDRFGLTRWSADTDEVTRVQFDSSMAAINTLGAIAIQGLRSARPTTFLGRRFYEATDTGVIYYDDGVQWRVVGSRVTNAVITPEAANQNALTVQGLSGQSGSLQAWLNSAGDTLAALGADGTMTAQRLIASGRTGATAFSAVSGDPDLPVATVAGTAGQVAHLQRWLNAAGQHVATIGPAGDLRAAGDITGATVGGGTVRSDGAVQATTSVSGATGRFSKDVAAPNLTGSATSPIGLHYYARKDDDHAVPTGVATGLAGLTLVSSQGGFTYNAGIITIPARGRWAISASCSFSANANGPRAIFLHVNDRGIASERATVVGTAFPTLAVSTSEVLNAGDEVHVVLLQESGVTLTAGKIGATPARFTLDYLGSAP